MNIVQSLDTKEIRAALGITDGTPIKINAQVVDPIINLRMNGWMVLFGKECDLEVNTALVDWAHKRLYMQFDKADPATAFMELLNLRICYYRRSESHIETFKVIVSKEEPIKVLDIHSNMWLAESKISNGIEALGKMSRNQINQASGLGLTAIEIAKYHSILSNLNKEQVDYLIDIITGRYKIRELDKVNSGSSKSMALVKFKVWGLIANTYAEDGRYWRATEEATIVQRLYNIVK
jgi:hypothetical protein